MRPVPRPTAPGQESVWAYPRPAILDRARKPVRVVFAGLTIAETSRAMRALETSHPPTYYIPPEDVASEYLRPAPGATVCEWKGQASYFDVVVGERTARRGAWCYSQPTPAFAPIAGWLAFYAPLMDACYVGDDRVTPQPGGFYGGWITSDVVGPFKGEPGTEGW